MDTRSLEEIIDEKKREEYLKTLSRPDRRRIEREAYRELRKSIRKLRRIH